MYEEYYGLNRQPFENTPNPDFFFASRQHREALASLVYGVMYSKGFMMVTGDVGTGKTFLAQALKYELGDEHIVLEVANPWITPEELVDRLPENLGMAVDPQWSTLQFQAKLKEHLKTLHKHGRRVLIILDEAQQLPERTLEGIRLLSNYETADAKLIQIVLLGQNELNDLLNRHSLRQLRQRITLNRTLGSLSATDTARYIQHRLKTAGREAELFTVASIELVHRHAKGAPRLINLICDNCLITGVAQEAAIIGEAIVREVVADLPLAVIGEQARRKRPEKVVNTAAATPQPALPEPPGAAASANGPVAEAAPDEVALPERKRRALLLAAAVGALLCLMLAWFVFQSSGEQVLTLGQPGTATEGGGVIAEKYQAPPEGVAPLQGQPGAVSDDRRPALETGVEALPDSQAESPAAGAALAGISRGSEPPAAAGVLVVVTGPNPVLRFDALASRYAQLAAGESLAQLATSHYGAWNASVRDLVQLLNPQLAMEAETFPESRRLNLPPLRKSDLLVAEGGHWYAYVATLTSREQADQLVTTYSDLGEGAATVVAGSRDPGLYRVFIGPYMEKQRLLARLEKLWLRHIPFIN